MAILAATFKFQNGRWAGWVKEMQQSLASSGCSGRSQVPVAAVARGFRFQLSLAVSSCSFRVQSPRAASGCSHLVQLPGARRMATMFGPSTVTNRDLIAPVSTPSPTTTHCTTRNATTSTPAPSPLAETRPRCRTVSHRQAGPP
eukprot:228230-Chlamydomonas_euryale.AAC.1